LLLYELLDRRPQFWTLDHYRCVILKRDSETPTTEAIVKLLVNDDLHHEVAEGDGPVNALDSALRKCLEGQYPALRDVHLVDYKVRVVNAQAETAAKVRVVTTWRVIEPTGNGRATKGYFSTIGVNENIVDASWQAITDAFAYHLIEVAAKD